MRPLWIPAPLLSRRPTNKYQPGRDRNEIRSPEGQKARILVSPFQQLFSKKKEEKELAPAATGISPICQDRRSPFYFIFFSIHVTRPPVPVD
jgi:hypothetical protein